MSNKVILFREDYIGLTLIDDGEGYPLFEILLDDDQSLCLTQFELKNLLTICTKYKKKIDCFINQVNNGESYNDIVSRELV